MANDPKVESTKSTPNLVVKIPSTRACFGTLNTPGPHILYGPTPEYTTESLKEIASLLEKQRVKLLEGIADLDEKNLAMLDKSDLQFRLEPILSAIDAIDSLAQPRLKRSMTAISDLSDRMSEMPKSTTREIERAITFGISANGLRRGITELDDSLTRILAAGVALRSIMWGDEGPVENSHRLQEANSYLTHKIRQLPVNSLLDRDET